MDDVRIRPEEREEEGRDGMPLEAGVHAPHQDAVGRVPMAGPRESGSNRCGKCGACTLCSDFDSSLSRTTSLESAAVLAAAAEENDDAALLVLTPRAPKTGRVMLPDADDIDRQERTRTCRRPAATDDTTSRARLTAVAFIFCEGLLQFAICAAKAAISY